MVTKRLVGLYPPSLFLLLTLLVLSPYHREALAAPFTSCSADSSGSSDASSAIQYCLDNSGGGTVTLAAGGTYRIANPLHFSVNGTTLTSDGSSHFTLFADQYLSGPIIYSSGVNGFTLSYATLIGRADPSGLHWSKWNLPVADCGADGFNATFDGNNFLIDHVESRYAVCGTGLGVGGSGFEVSYSYVHDNGWELGTGGGGSWADGMTVDHCDYCYIHDNTVEDNTDVDIVVGGGYYGTVSGNSISNSHAHGFAGIHVGWFPGGAGDHTGMSYYGNTISSSSLPSDPGGNNTGLFFGLVVGFNPWYYAEDRHWPSAPTSEWVSNAGSVTYNTISGATVNLAVDGIGDGYVQNNGASSHQGSDGFGAGCSNAYSTDYAAYDFGAASIQGSWAAEWFIHGNCGTWNTALPWPTDPGVLRHGQWLEAGDTLDSPSGTYHLAYQGDGNLVLYNSSWSPVWAQPGAVGGAYRAWMQEDGNLVVYSASVWATHTEGHSGAYLAVQDGGNLVVYALDGTVLWSLF